jgi:CBS-domain-containing membrane protein
MQAGVSALPVLDEQGGLIDIYARADITALAAANAYNRLQWEDVTVGQALRLGVSAFSPTVRAASCHLKLVPVWAFGHFLAAPQPVTQHWSMSWWDMHACWFQV